MGNEIDRKMKSSNGFLVIFPSILCAIYLWFATLSFRWKWISFIGSVSFRCFSSYFFLYFFFICTIGNGMRWREWRVFILFRHIFQMVDYWLHKKYARYTCNIAYENKLTTLFVAALFFVPFSFLFFYFLYFLCVIFCTKKGIHKPKQSKKKKWKADKGGSRWR